MAFEIADIGRLDAGDFALTLETESRLWQDRLRWDFAPSAQLISACLREKRISGYALLREGKVAGYCFFFCEGDKGLIGNLFVDPWRATSDHAVALLERAIETLMRSRVQRIEAQLPHFAFSQLDPCFRAHCFEGYRRRFMLASLKKSAARSPARAVWEAEGVPPNPRPFEDFVIQSWDPKYDQAATELVYRAYAQHVDSEINDQYRSPAGTARLLENIAQHRGCGEYLPGASIVAIHRSTQKLAAILAFTAVRPQTAHIPQLAVAKEFQGAGLARTLMEFSLADRAKDGYQEVSLTVTDLNAGAVRLYERLGFETLRTFGAFVWKRHL